VTHTFTIYGKPVPKARKAFARGRFAKVVLDEKSRTWESVAAAVFSGQWDRPPLKCIVASRVVVVAERPKTKCRKKDPEGYILRDQKPDADNVLKSVCDALTKAGVIADDKQIAHKEVLSLWAPKDGRPFVRVMLYELFEIPEQFRILMFDGN
jgi:Holliday junction resolvase RusA-like endonuclease